jgi:hypothetical protein
MTDRPLVARTPLPWVIFFGLFAVATTVNAQPTPRDQPHTLRAGTGVIRGRYVGYTSTSMNGAQKTRGGRLRRCRTPRADMN